MRRLATLLCAALLLGGCTPPSKQYVAADGLGMFFALPKAWDHLPSKQLTTAETGWKDDVGGVFQQTVRWQGAWSAELVNANDVLAAKPTAKPVVFAFVRDLISVEQQSIGSNVSAALQDLVLPASTLSEGVVKSTSVKSGGFRGIRQVATYASGGARQTTELVAVLGPRKDRVYAVIVRCTAKCFTDNRADIAALFRSVTFKESRA